MQQEKCRAETIEEFLARGGQIERVEDHPNPEGRVMRRGARNLRPEVLARPALPQRRS
jgi:hypothetical protein